LQRTALSLLVINTLILNPVPVRKPSELAAVAVINAVDLDFFETVGIAVENGREFIEHDREDSTPVAIVNEKLAHDYWPNASALGKRIQLPGETFMRQIAGVAKNAKLLHFRRAGTTMRLHSA
jgi:MacB-like periplasmic core domain